VIIEPFVHAGQVFVDGGLVNNLPIDVMRRRTKGPLIAIDVSPETTFVVESRSKTDKPRSWLRRKLFAQGRGRPKFGLFDILMRSFTISSAQRVAEHKSQLDLYIKPDVSALSSSDFGAYDELLAAGHAAASAGAKQLRERLAAHHFLVQDHDRP
jgi:predicted acylesterase/phospholipase RssA